MENDKRKTKKEENKDDKKTVGRRERMGNTNEGNQLREIRETDEGKINVKEENERMKTLPTNKQTGKKTEKTA